MQNYFDLKKELMKNPRFKREYDALGPEFKALQKILDLRLKKKMSQKELAKKMGTTQSAISRFEAGCVQPTIEFLARLARVFDKKLVIDFK